MTEVVLGLGSNMSYNGKSSIDLLCESCIELKKIIFDLKFSSVYKTKAMYVSNQDDFFNMVVSGKVNSDISPHKLLDLIHNIEYKLGRNRDKEIRFGPRSVDIDIELFGDENICDSDLIIPHPRLKERAFVLVPLVEILKFSADTVKNETYTSYLKYISTDGIKLYMSAKEFSNLLLGGSN